jgi:hypothetical protein
MHLEVEDAMLPNYTMFIGENSLKWKNNIDLVKADDIESDHTPRGLSKMLFGLKLFIVWDPCRIANRVLLNPHLGVHANMDGGASTWTFQSVRDSLESLGGLCHLIPLFGILDNIVPWKESSLGLKGVMNDFPNMLVPSLLFLVSSFIRDHQNNACKLYRCGGINVVEKCLRSCKIRDIEEGAWYRTGASSFVAKYTASTLLDQWQASWLNFALETTVFSKLVLNIPLLFGGISKSNGVSFHAEMLPIISEITMSNPDKVRDCVDINEVLDVVHEYSSGKEVRQSVHLFHCAC